MTEQMSDVSRPAGTSRPYARNEQPTYGPAPANLADILERVLDKGIVIAGDIKVNLLEIELLTIQIRLLVVSVDKAVEMGIDWWRNDPMYNSRAAELAEENRRLQERIKQLEGSDEDREEPDEELEEQDDEGEEPDDE